MRYKTAIFVAYGQKKEGRKESAVMVFVLIVTHGHLGEELLKSAELIMGEQKDAMAMALNLGDEVDHLKSEVEKVVVENKVAGKETIMFVDVLGGSPSNVALYMLKKYGVKVITGVNLPMLLEMFSSRNSVSLDELVDSVAKSGVDGIHKFE